MTTLPQSFFNHDAQAGGFFPLAHVGIQIDKLGDRQNALIEGIRGTGKTHILKMIKRHHLNNFERDRILPVYVSLAEISEHAKKDPDEFRIHLYARVVSTTIETLDANKHHLSPNRGIVKGAVRLMAKGLGLERYFSYDDIDADIDEIKEIADELLFKLNYDISAAELKSFGKTSQSDTREARASLEAKGSLPSVGQVGTSASAGATRGETHEEVHEETVKVLGSRLAHNNASQFIIAFLQQVQVILDLQYTIILLDECSEASQESQVEIFRFFKAVRGSNSKLADRDDCAFFAGTVYPGEETYYPSRAKDGFSFEPGQDCGMEFIQWDETEPETYLKFFEDMLIARARAVSGYKDTAANFIATYFGSRKNFNLIAFCAGGTPRRFWELSKRSYDSGTNQISYARAKIAIQEIVHEQVLGHSNLLPDDHGMINHIIKTLTKKNEDARRLSKRKGALKIPQGTYFSAAQTHANYFSRLIMQGAIYDKSRMKSRRHSLRPHPIFALDTGIAFSYRVIPEKNFDLIAETDFPASTSNGFASAASFEPPRRSSDPSWSIASLTEPVKRPKSVTPAATIKGDQIHGVIKSIRPSGNAFASASDGGPDVFIAKADMKALASVGGVKGSEITFNVSKNNLGRQASNIKLLEVASGPDAEKVKEDIKSFICDLVSQKRQVALARVAHEVRNHFGDEIGSQGWLGHSKFTSLLSSLGLQSESIDFDSQSVYQRSSH